MHLQRLHYAGYYSGAHRNAQRYHGGAAVMVRQDIPSRLAWQCCEQGGAALAAWVAGRLICSVHLAPHVEAQPVADAVTEMMLSIPHRTSWLLGGNFNATPSENVLIRTLETLACVASHPDCPTRWEPVLRLLP